MAFAIVGQVRGHTAEVLGLRGGLFHSPIPGDTQIPMSGSLQLYRIDEMLAQLSGPLIHSPAQVSLSSIMALHS